MKKFFFSLAAVWAALCGLAQTDDSVFIRRMADQILTNGKAYDDLRVLTKSVGPRLAGSPGMYKSEAWGLKTMQDAGAEKAWLQECMVPHWVRGGKDKATASFKAKGKATTKKLDVLALGNSAGSMKPLKAEVIEITSFTELETKKDQLKGKIVFYNYRFNDAFVNTFTAY
ncbi:MAG: peptidase M28 family protein, partial [Chitinophagaceae bacterium]